MHTHLTVGTFTPSILLSLARRTGRLAAAGLAVEEVPVASSPAQFEALLSGDLAVAFTSPDNVLAYRFSQQNPLGLTADVRIVSGIDRGMGLALYGQRGILDAAELSGGTLAVDVPTSGFAVAMYALTDSLGLRRDDYKIAAIGSTPKRLRALLAGECDATMLNAGNELLAEAAGCHPLARVSQVCHPYLGTVLSIAGDTHLDTASSLANALRETAIAVCEGALAHEAVEEAGSLLDLTEPLAAQYVAKMRDAREGLVREELIDLDGLRTVIDLRRRYLPELIDGSDVLDTSLDRDSGLLAIPPGPPGTP